MILEKFRTPGKARARYVRATETPGVYAWCEQSADDRRFDVAQGTCSGKDLPADIRAKCDEYRGVHYACEWPL